jgi:NDP-sugar pyrophosphorylase family protein
MRNEGPIRRSGAARGFYANLHDIMPLTLLVLAAGVGSRYGGLKQIDPVGPNGVTIIDYSIYDARRTGFDKLVFVIRREIEVAFKEIIGSRFEKRITVEYVFQDVPPHRQKPWGTGDAILKAREVVHEPFAAINADDFYGRNSYHLLAEHLRAGGEDYAMVGFRLSNTLSEFGSVARGVCECDADGYLRSVTELTKVERADGGAVADGRKVNGDEIVSMNLWGFTPAIFAQLEHLFAEFLRERGQQEKAEFFIPTAVNELIKHNEARVKVLPTSDSWFGVTYREDRRRVIESIRQLIARGEYPEKLWS